MIRRARSAGAVLRLALGAPALAIGFVCVFDAVTVVTAWQHLGRGAAVLVQAASTIAQGGAGIPAAAIEAAFARAEAVAGSAGPGRTGSIGLWMFAPDGTGLGHWHRGTPVPVPVPAPGQVSPSGCGAAAFVAELARPVPDWLVAAQLVRSLLPSGLRVRAVACARNPG